MCLASSSSSSSSPATEKTIVRHLALIAAQVVLEVSLFGKDTGQGDQQKTLIMEANDVDRQPLAACRICVCAAY